MVRPIVHDVMFLSRRSAPAVKEDITIGKDLLDTLVFHRLGCVGLAANMIGISKSIIAVSLNGRDVVMYNPVITKKSGPYETEEGCLSLSGVRKTTRYSSIEVEYFDERFKKHTLKLSDFPAQIVQHEVDHLNGILI